MHIHKEKVENTIIKWQRVLMYTLFMGKGERLISL